MLPTAPDLAHIALVGIGATAVLDAWLWLLRGLGVPTGSFALIGRWVGHMARGQLRHAAIGRAARVPHELLLGWLTHYGVGIAFAGLLVLVQGRAWLQAPAVLPAVLVGAATVLMPLAVMQPAMGLGFAASKTPAPNQNRLRSLANHTVFGLGLYLAAALLAQALA